MALVLFHCICFDLSLPHAIINFVLLRYTAVCGFLNPKPELVDSVIYFEYKQKIAE